MARKPRFVLPGVPQHIEGIGVRSQLLLIYSLLNRLKQINVKSNVHMEVENGSKTPIYLPRCAATHCATR